MLSLLCSLMRRHTAQNGISSVKTHSHSHILLCFIFLFYLKNCLLLKCYFNNLDIQYWSGFHKYTEQQFLKKMFLKEVLYAHHVSYSIINAENSCAAAA